jgi:hypothetical protein
VQRFVVLLVASDRGRATARKNMFGDGFEQATILRTAELQETLAFLPRQMPKPEADGEMVYGSINGLYGTVARYRSSCLADFSAFPVVGCSEKGFCGWAYHGLRLRCGIAG